VLNRTRVLGEAVKMCVEICARSIKRLEGSRLWFAADAGPMEIEWEETAVWSVAGTVR
jgi:hypothetical protein